MRVHTYLEAQATEQLARHANPVVAMDQIAAKSRAQRLQRLADELSGMSDEGALRQLRLVRDRNTLNPKNTTTVVFSLSEMQWFAGVVDGIAYETTGWIEVRRSGFDGTRMLNLPHYRRMPGINNCANSIARNVDESDDAWLKRRAEWLSSYHPDVKVLHSQKRWLGNGVLGDIDLGTVESFGKQVHLVEADLISVRGYDMPDGVKFEIVDAFMAPDASGAIGRVRQVAGAPRALGIMKLRDYSLEVVA